MFKAKFKVSSVTAFEGVQVEVKMNPVLGDNDFTKFTPSGELKFYCTNPEVNKQIAPGKTFFLTFTEEGELLTAEPLKALSEHELISILAKNNHQLKEAIEKQEQAKESNCPVNIEEAARNCGVESGEGLMLVKLIQFLRGEKTLDELA